jgi:oxygen-independent coproporphyrinogen-3 oxidase
VDEDSRLGAEILRGGQRYGAAERPGDDLAAELYDTAVDRLAAMGIRQYEISNFARPGFESLQNLKYWHREPYAGFGADAHSFDGAVRRRTPDTPGGYIERIERGEPAFVECVPAEAEEEEMYLGLRLREGMQPTPRQWSRFGAAIERFVAAGLLERGGETLRLTRRGILLSNEVFQEFI